MVIFWFIKIILISETGCLCFLFLLREHGKDIIRAAALTCAKLPKLCSPLLSHPQWKCQHPEKGKQCLSMIMTSLRLDPWKETQWLPRSTDPHTENWWVLIIVITQILWEVTISWVNQLEIYHTCIFGSRMIMFSPCKFCLTIKIKYAN